jgi:hypothetical protein
MNHLLRAHARRTIHPLRALASALLAGLLVAPGTVAAQELTPDQLAVAFSRAGFEVEAPITWTWLSPSHTTLRVRDHAAERVLLVIVYGDAATAAAEQRRAGAQVDGDAANGPRLVPGYGPSSWRQNIALVQARQRDLDRWLATELQRSMGMPAMASGGPLVGDSLATLSVDADVLAALDSLRAIDL